MKFDWEWGDQTPRGPYTIDREESAWHVIVVGSHEPGNEAIVLGVHDPRYRTTFSHDIPFEQNNWLPDMPPEQLAELEELALNLVRARYPE